MSDYKCPFSAQHRPLAYGQNAQAASDALSVRNVNGPSPLERLYVTEAEYRAACLERDEWRARDGRMVEAHNKLVDEINRVNRVLSERDARIAYLEFRLAKITESTQE